MPTSTNNENFDSRTPLSQGYLDGLRKFKEQEEKFIIRMTQLSPKSLKIISTDHNKLPVTDPVISDNYQYIYFRKDTTNISSEIRTTIDKLVNTTIKYCSTWKELDEALDMNPTSLTFHISMLEQLNLSVPEIIRMITTKIKLYGKDVIISVSIDKDTPAYMIPIFKKAGVFGIVPDSTSWGIEETIHGIIALGERVNYWPAHIIDMLPKVDADLPTVLFFASEGRPLIKTQNPARYAKEMALFKLEFCYTWDCLLALINSSVKVVLIKYSRLQLQNLSPIAVVEIISSILHSNESKSTRFGMVITPDVTKEKIKEFKRAGFSGIVPSADHWDITLTVNATQALLTGSYWPAEIIEKLPSNAPVEPTITIIDTSIASLTSRQQQVSELVCNRGLSNKQIAKSLQISESTVKIHVSNIMKIYGVRNRTQLLLAAKDSLHA